MFYLMMHSTHFIYGYMASGIIMVKDHSDSERGNPLRNSWWWRIDLTTHCTMSKRSYHGATSRSIANKLVFERLTLGYSRTDQTDKILVDHYFTITNITPFLCPFSYFTFQPVLHDWCNKGHGMCYPVCGMVHIKEPLLLIGKSSLCGGIGFPFSLSEWSLTICLTPYNRK